MSKKKSTIAAAIIVLVLLGLFLGSYGQYQLAAVPSLVYEKFSLTDTQFSSIMTSPMIPSILFSIVIGILVDKFGITKMVSICFAITMAGFILRLFSGSYGTVLIAMILTGFGCTILNGNMSKIAISLYSPEKIGLIVGILMAGSTAAMAVAYGTTSFSPSLTAAFWVTAVASVVIFAAWLIIVREKHFSSDAAAQAESVPVKEALLVSVKSTNVWLLGLSLMTLLGGAMVISNFQVAYLTTYKGYSESLAGTFGTVLMVGAIIGSIVIPAFVLRSKRSGIIMLIMGLLIAVTTVLLVTLPTAGIYIASFLNGGIRSGVIAVLMSLPAMFPEIGPKYAGTAGGVAVTLELIGAVVIPTYVVIPLSGGSMLAYFYIGAAFIAVSAILAAILMRRYKKA